VVGFLEAANTNGDGAMEVVVAERSDIGGSRERK